MMPVARAVLRLLAFLILCVLVVPPQLMVLFVHKGRGAYVIPKLFHRLTCILFNIKIRVQGEHISQCQTLFVSNHLSYLDIPVMGSILTASFVAKSDVSDWPVFGFLSKLQQTVFISRDREQAKTGQSALQIALSEGKSLIFFPEGTSTDGADVQPFKSSLFSIALDKKLPVQPFVVTVRLVNGKVPQTQEERDLYAWHVNMDMDLGPHLWRFLKLPGIVVTLHFFPVLSPSTFENRKDLSKTCYEKIARNVRIHNQHA